MREIIFIKKSPKIDMGKALFTEITPSKYINMIDCCIYSLILQRSSDPSHLLPNHPSALTGSVAHKLIELALKGEIDETSNFNEYWLKQIEKQEINLIKIHPNADFLLPLVDFQKKRATKEIVNNLIANSKVNLKKSNLSSEKSLSFQFLKGQIDLIIEGDLVEIIDYKSGNVLDDNGEIKEVYQLQLKLYAILYQKTFNRLVDKLIIINLNGEKHYINFNQPELDKLYKEVEESFQKINELISSESFDNLYCKENTPCKYCRCKPVCNYYWDNCRNSEYEISGKLIQIERVNYSLFKLTIRTILKDFYFHLDKSYFVIEQLDRLMNKTIRVFNIRINDEILNTTKMTMIYGFED